LTALAAALVAAAVAAAVPTPAERDAFHDAKRHWREQRARDYTYLIERTCFCLPEGPVRVRVVNRRPRKTPDGYESVDTARELFALAARALRSEGEHTVRYRPRLGLPKLIAADPILNAADEEYSYRITGLRITRRYPPNGG
jgi:hypothetical protein